MRVGIATDHGGFNLKEELVAYLRETGHEVTDMGAHTLTSGDDYPDYVIPLARAVASGKLALRNIPAPVFETISEERTRV